MIVQSATRGQRLASLRLKISAGRHARAAALCCSLPRTPGSTPAAASTMTGRATIAAMNSALQLGYGRVRNGIIKATQAILSVA